MPRLAKPSLRQTQLFQMGDAFLNPVEIIDLHDQVRIGFGAPDRLHDPVPGDVAATQRPVAVGIPVGILQMDMGQPLSRIRDEPIRRRCAADREGLYRRGELMAGRLDGRFGERDSQLPV